MSDIPYALQKLIKEQNRAIRGSRVSEAPLPGKLVSAHNGAYFRLVDAVRELANQMGVEPTDLCSDVADTFRETARRGRR